MSSLIDAYSQMQANALAGVGLGSCESPYRSLAESSRWRLRDYGGALGGQPLLIIAAPIKRPYIWDIETSVSVVRRCLGEGRRVFMLEWLPPSDRDDVGLDDYVSGGISPCVEEVCGETGGRPALLGHSLGGTFAAIFAALASDRISGLALLGAPLCFDAASSAFRDAVAAMAPSRLSEVGVVPGWVLSRFAASASPDEFVWSRYLDAALSLADHRLLAIRARVERWALDEVPLPARLVGEILQWLYRENRFCRGALRIRGEAIGPSRIRVPTLAVVSAADRVTPRTAVTPFLEALQAGTSRLIEHQGEVGVGLQHLAILVGPKAHAQVWPQIFGWLDSLP
jgi:polyhydroxyalkanoate synthase